MAKPPMFKGETVPAAEVGLGAGASAAMATLRREKMVKMTAIRVDCIVFAIDEVLTIEVFFKREKVKEISFFRREEY